VNVFFPVLNWGLGHASRSLPMIKQYMAEGHTVICASDGEALAMLRRELPGQTVLELPGYGILYNSRYMPLNMVRYGPGMLRTMKAEHELTRAIVDRHQIDCIVTDNRYGCYHPDIPSAIITHQLQVFTGNHILDVYIRRQIRAWIKKFNEVWIPDNPPANNITGELADIDIAPIPKYYIGIVSELEAQPKKGRYRAVAVISGPEPQRTHFEHIIVKQLSELEGQFVIVRGKPDVHDEPRVEGNLIFYPFMTRAELSELLQETDIVISRSGYTTLMDLARTGHKAILCPTPGQYEQIYLGDRLGVLNQCVYARQENLDLRSALRDVEGKMPIGGGLPVDQDFLGRLRHLAGQDEDVPVPDPALR
jgi:UDP:flavonoid glycosyltransferase YjiC (YdhE family)